MSKEELKHQWAMIIDDVIRKKEIIAKYSAEGLVSLYTTDRDLIGFITVNTMNNKLHEVTFVNYEKVTSDVRVFILEIAVEIEKQLQAIEV